MNTLQALLSFTPTTIEWIGTCAAILTTGSFIPQAWLIFRTRQVEGVSVGMYSAFTTGVALWLLYGVATGSWPITIANAMLQDTKQKKAYVRNWMQGQDKSATPMEPLDLPEI